MIQFLFEFDSKRILGEPTIDQIWEALLINDRQGIRKYSDDIAPKRIEELVDTNQNPLYLAQQDYYCKPLKNLFEDPDVGIQRTAILKIALD